VTGSSGATSTRALKALMAPSNWWQHKTCKVQGIGSWALGLQMVTPHQVAPRRALNSSIGIPTLSVAEDQRKFILQILPELARNPRYPQYAGPKPAQIYQTQHCCKQCIPPPTQGGRANPIPASQVIDPQTPVSDPDHSQRCPTLMRASAPRQARLNGMKKECASWASSCSEALWIAGTSASTRWQAPLRRRRTSTQHSCVGNTRCSALQRNCKAGLGRVGEHRWVAQQWATLCSHQAGGVHKGSMRCVSKCKSCSRADYSYAHLPSLTHPDCRR
jgi:hypothetical protein